MTDHRAEAVRLLALAEGTYLDDSHEPANRDHYTTEDEWVDALEFASQMHEQNVAEAHMFAQMATAHALLAQFPGAPTVREQRENADNEPDFYVQEFPYPGGHVRPCAYVAGISGTCNCDLAKE